MRNRARFFAACCLTPLLVLLPTVPVFAAQIAGVPPPLPPGLERKLQIIFANDVFSSGGNSDDYRTQQFTVSTEFAGNWVAVLDHSLLTLEEPQQGPPGRQDQLTGSLGYTFLRQSDDNSSRLFQLGSGLRYSGEIGGSRIQNGFHQLNGSSIKTMPYVNDIRAAATFWGLYRHDGRLASNVELPLLGDEWQLGYWGRASALLTTDSARDANLSLNLVAKKSWFNAWVGLQGNIRSGHNRNIVESETARFEEGVSTVVGFRLGPLVIETERKIDGDGGYGYFGLTSSGEPIVWPGKINGFELQTSITQPDVYAVIQGRLRSAPASSTHFSWARYWSGDLMYGKPQFDGRTDRFVETWQIAIAREWSAKLAGYEWLQGYVSVGPGWRSEKIVGEGAQLGGIKSTSVGRAGLFSSFGLRFGTATRHPDRWRMLLHFGVRGWLPTSASNVPYAGETLRLQKPQLTIDSGVVFVFR